MLRLGQLACLKDPIKLIKAALSGRLILRSIVWYPKAH
jgi:hypothetical protein